MLFKPEKLKKMLVEPGFVAEKDFNLALKEAKERNMSLEEVLVEHNIISDRELGFLIAEELSLPFVDLKKENISSDVLKIVPEVVAKMQQVIVFDKTKDGLKIAMANPKDYKMVKWLEKKTGEKVKVYYATPSAIREALKFYRKEIKEEFADIIQTQLKKIREGETGVEKIPVIKIVDTIIQYAYENRSSDIHIEPLEKETRIRFRIDGILHNVLSLPKSIHDLIVSRVKVLAKLRTDEHFAAQDGKFIAEFGKEKFDIRVSIVPVTEGEKVVMRLLSERIRKFDLEKLGLLGRDLKKVKAAIKKPFGMILSSGPTGCGKTTTLYSILKILNRPEVNISTIEDPVEYDIEGVNQIQVNPKTNITFAKGLRSIVRQDPDIIMVGEIRDPETASIAINAAMTGHLVLSTMHANTAATNLPRLIDMGIEPFLVASSVNIIIAQRLVRRICTKCRESYEITKKDLEKFHLSEELLKKIFKGKKKIRVFRGKGCRACVNTGYFGRTGIFEVLEMKENIQKLIMEKADADQIQKQAIKNGMTTMLEDGIEKALLGITTIEEVIRVTKQ